MTKIYITTLILLEKSESNQIFKNKYDVAIYTVGLSIYPILLSLSTIKPKKKLFYYVVKKVCLMEK